MKMHARIEIEGFTLLNPLTVNAEEAYMDRRVSNN